MTTKRRRTTTRSRTVTRRAPRAVEPWRMELRPVVIATDGSDAAKAALTLGKWMDQLGAWSPQVITVLEALPVSMTEVIVPPAIELQQLVSDGILDRVTRQIKKAGRAAWKLEIRHGSAAPAILDFAARQQASLIVMGLGKHGKLARFFGAETASRVARNSRVPVLAVDASAAGPPRSAVVAMDFGDSSVAAARETLKLLERPSRMHLIHVRFALDGTTGRSAEWERTYADGVEVGFARILNQLGPQPGMTITTELRLGGVTESILAAAKKKDADLIAVGSHNRGLVDRLVIGSTPAHLLRAARCSVLVTPPAEPYAE